MIKHIHHYRSLSLKVSYLLISRLSIFIECGFGLARGDLVLDQPDALNDLAGLIGCVTGEEQVIPRTDHPRKAHKEG